MHPTCKGLMLGASVLALLCAGAFAELDARLDEHWDLWKTTHQRKYYNKVEELNRRTVWEKNLLRIDTHNLEASMGLHTYTMAMNHMGDLTKEEAVQTYATLRIPKDFERKPSTVIATGAELPASVDWRKHGFVTRVKNQGQCGSCWAFSTVGTMEGHLFRTTGKLVDLSPQQLVDCSRSYGNYGCQGGLMDKAFEYIIQMGLESDSAYPYIAENDDCQYKAQSVVANCSTFSFVPQGSEERLKEAVAYVGPISVGVDADQMIFYSSGIFSDPNCNSRLNHGVVVVGYGTGGQKDFWLVKNSWGEGWGEDGYIRIARNEGNMCLIANYATYCDV